jgi:late competence protein required for DNA uptake (superfamily II DNA/RNA helicase)
MTLEGLETIGKMESIMRCQVCGKKTHELRFWFDNMLCHNCYNVSRTRSEMILEATP